MLRVDDFNLNFILSKIESKLRKILYFIYGGKFWHVKILAAGVIYCLLVSCPRYSDIFLYIKGPYQQNDGAIHLLKQIERPFDTKNYISIDPGSHFAKRVFRVTVPIICNLSKVSSTNEVYLVQIIIGLLGLYALIWTVFKIVNDAFLTLIILIGFLSIYSGKLWLSQYAMHFDGVSYSFMFLAMLDIHPVINLIFLILGYFNDERALLSGFWVLFYFIIANKGRLNLKTALALASFPVYAGLRFGIGYFFHLHTPIGDNSNIGLPILISNLGGIQYEALRMLEGFWIIFGIVILVWWKDKKWIYLSSFLALLILGIGTSCLIFDVNRSLSYSVEVLIISLFVLKSKMPHTYSSIVLVAALLCVFIPTHCWIGNYGYFSDTNFIGVEVARYLGYLRNL